MKISIRISHLVLLLLIASFVIGSLCVSDDSPGFQWNSAEPSEVGLSSEKIQRLKDGLESCGTQALFVVCRDRVVCEWCSPDSGADRKHGTASLAKALIGGMSLILALQDGLLHIDDPADRYIEEWKQDPTRSGITIKQLATHSSGIEDAEVNGMSHTQSGGWKSRFWNHDPDPFTIARDWAPMKFQPGTAFEYSNPGMAMLSYTITVALNVSSSPHKDVRTYLRDRIMRPIGVPDSEWSCGYGKTFTIHDLPLVANWGGGSFTARAVARIGRLLLHHGEWEGKQILDPQYIEIAVSDAGTPTPFRGQGEGPCPRAGLAWWVNSDGILSKLPSDAFMGAGAGNQVLLVVPSLDLIAVRFGALIDPRSFWGGMELVLFNPLMECFDK